MSRSPTLHPCWRVIGEAEGGCLRGGEAAAPATRVAGLAKLADFTYIAPSAG